VIPVVMLHRNMSAGLCRPSNGNLFRIAVCVISLIVAGVSAIPGIEPDQAAPDFNAVDLDGISRKLDDFSGTAIVLLFWRPEAERARNAVCEVADALSKGYDGAHLVTIVSGEHERTEIQSVLEHCGKPVPVLLDRDRVIFAAYHIIALPTLMILSSDRKMEYKEAGFSHEGISNLTARLDEIYGRKRTETALPVGSPEAIRRYGLAMQFLRKGLTERAEELLAQLVTNHPEYRPAWVSLGYCRISSGKVEESRESLEKAHSLDQKNTDVAAGLAWVWWKKGDRAQSAKWAAMVSGDDPNRNLILEINK